MLENIRTKKKPENFEEKIIEIYNKFVEKEIDDEYMPLWNGFVDLIEYIQELDKGNDMSPIEAIDMMKQLGLTNEDFKQLLLGSINNDSK